MTWIVNWKGTDFDVDPSELTGLELSLIKQRTTLTFPGLMKGVQELDGDAIRAIFWVVERRNDPELKFSEYDGPPMRVIIPALPAYGEALEDLGKGLPEPPGTPGKTGSPPSPDSTDAPTGTSGSD